MRDVAGFLTEGLPNLFNTVVQFAGAFFLLYFLEGRSRAVLLLGRFPLYVELLNRSYS